MEKITIQDDRLLTRKQVAQILGLHKVTLSNLAVKGRGPAYFKDGGIVRYRASDVSEWIEKQIAHR